LRSSTCGVLYNEFAIYHYGLACLTTAHNIYILPCLWAGCQLKFKAPQNGYSAQELGKFQLFASSL